MAQFTDSRFQKNHFLGAFCAISLLCVACATSQTNNRSPALVVEEKAVHTNNTSSASLNSQVEEEAKPKTGLKFGPVIDAKFKFNPVKWGQRTLKDPENGGLHNGKGVLIEATDSPPCVKDRYFLSSKKLEFQYAESFCEGLNSNSEVKSKTGKWEIANMASVPALKINCPIGEALKSSQIFNDIFEAEYSYEVFIDHVGRFDLAPYNVVTYPLNNEVLPPKSFKTKVSTTKAAVLCVFKTSN